MAFVRQDTLLGILVIISAVQCASTPIRLVGGSANTGRVEIFYKSHWMAIASITDDDAEVACRMLGFKDGDPIFHYTGSSGQFGSSHGEAIFNGFGCLGNETDYTECSTTDLSTLINHRSDSILSCGHTNVRLVGGDRPSVGRVEVQFGSEWMPFCMSRFGDGDGKVLCNMLGYGSGISQFFSDTSDTGGASTSMVTGLGCYGNEDDVKECTGLHFGRRSDCYYGTDVGLQCGATPIRLANGPNNSSGRVEIMHGGQWGTICGESGPLRHGDVKVICNMLGIYSTDSFGYSMPFYGEGFGPIITKNLRCTGSEADLATCPSEQWSLATKSCSHNKDIGVNCGGVTNIRLIDGTSEQSGRLEVYRDGHWGTVSGRQFSRQNLEVVCRMLGYESSAGSFFRLNSHYGLALGEVVLSDLSCNGLEADIGACLGTWYPDTRTTDHDHDIGVNCDGVIPLRLVGGPSNSSGRVELYHNGRYGTVCETDFDRRDLIVVCRMLGYENIPASAYWHKSAYYGAGLGEIVVTSLKCNGIENNLGQCGAIWGSDYDYCDHRQDVSVSCDGATEQLRLINGTSTHDGRVEILHRGQWGQICDNNFDRADAVVICRELGFANPEEAAVVTHADSVYGKGQGSWVVSRLACNGLESNLDLCSASWLPTSTYGCRPVGVRCCPSCDASTVVG